MLENKVLFIKIIRKIYPSKKSGYFWIKTLCMPEVERMFCDFSINNGQGYLWIPPKTGDKFDEVKSALDL